ncbi:preprotein translocase subunit SecG [Candidatus Woesebacteria bacterium]|nr:preprotein translocase subunit SecG [Candidatus Woesebacteria bacterium]MCD8507220.1 preprotein translocase subunit SecG [Candidatus Woesebacteria bacterium]MCD8526704.1 preprotein translocase subunit SecG [Candidatus Woesebacteria bacterium]MCD8546552.1 preprotein translocase subunit SecG [Candidatus Woesebacteria bacterium]
MNILFIALILIVILIVGSILLQPGENGFLGGGSIMGGGENYHTRRGLEKFLFYATFVLIALFVIMSIFLVRAA